MTNNRGIGSSYFAHLGLDWRHDLTYLSDIVRRAAVQPASLVPTLTSALDLAAWVAGSPTLRALRAQPVDLTAFADVSRVVHSGGVIAAMRNAQAVSSGVEWEAARHITSIINLERSLAGERLPWAADMLTLPLKVIENSVATVQYVREAVAPMLASGLLRVPETYIAFADRQSQRVAACLHQGEDQAAAVAGAILMHASVVQAESDARILAVADELGTITRDSVMDRRVPYNYYPSLNQHLGSLYARPGVPKLHLAMSTCRPELIRKAATALIDKIYEINSVCISSVGNETAVFNASGRGYVAVNRMSLVVATNEDIFGHIVDQLYFLLYEGSDSGKRLWTVLPEQHPVWEPLRRLRHLRRHYRHDVEQGTGVSGKLRQNREAFLWWTGQMPSSPSEWKQLQQAVYSRLAGMLDEVYRKLEHDRATGSPPSTS